MIMVISFGNSGYAYGVNKSVQEVTSSKTKEAEMAEKTGFTVETIQPDTQIDPNYSFFYARTKPQEEQALKVKIISKQKEPIKVKIDLTNAVTNIRGQIDYGQLNAAIDRSMVHPLTDFVSVETPEITVKNYEEKIVEIKVTPPNDSFDGVRLGALVFTNVEEKNSQTGITSSYGYKIAIMLSEDLRPYNEGGQIKYKKVKARLQNGEKVVATTMQNPEPKVIENLTTSTKLRKKGEKEVLASNSYTGMKIAPNSSFDCLTYLGIEDLKPGKYVLTVQSTDGNNQWNWNKEFEISQKQADDINKDAAYKILLPKLYKQIGAGLLLVTVLNIAYLLYRRKNSRKVIHEGEGSSDQKETKV